jgi:hypothetical protein
MKQYLTRALFAFVVVLSGCASANLPDDTTPAEKRAAMCMDAKAGLGMADAAMDTATDPVVMKYWTAFKAGAVVGVQTYCGGE